MQAYTIENVLIFSFDFSIAPISAKPFQHLSDISQRKPNLIVGIVI